MPKMVNRYWLVARVYPALLALAPVLWTTVVLAPQLVSDYLKGTASVLAIGCALYLLSSLARSQGKFAETQLLERWGGWPTTILLRHRDKAIDPYTKARYHQALAGLVGTALPFPAEEPAAPADADDAYRSATKRLIELRRGAEFQIIHDENASYGFRRNLFGLRPIAVGLALTPGAVTALIWWAELPKPVDLGQFAASVRAYPYLPVLLAADFAYAIMLALIITTWFVRQAADEYALALFRSLES